MTAVQNLIKALADQGIESAWGNTGGGCYAVIIPWSNAEILVTEREDVFGESDYASDDEVGGFFVGGVTPEADEIYATVPDAGEPARIVREAQERGDDVFPVDLDAEVTYTVDAIVAFFAENN